MRKLVFFLTVLFIAGRASAQSNVRTDIPQILVSGMEAYKPGNPELGIKAWTKNSPLEGTQAATDEVAPLRQAQSLYGPFQGFDIISNHEISPRVRIIYLTMNYEAGPLFGHFILYRTEHGWIVSSFDFSLDDSKILPITVE